MAQVGDRPARLVHLVENVVAEQLDQVPVARLGPSRVVVKPGEEEGGFDQNLDRRTRFCDTRLTRVAR